MLSRYAKSELLYGILDLVRHTPQGAGKSWLERGLTITEPSYWANRLVFGIVNRRSSALFGQRKAADIVVNVVLPFAYAWGQMTAEPVLKKRAIDIYHHHPRMEDNELTRYMKQQLRMRQDDNISACQQQGLKHIFKNNCRHKNCSICPVALS